MAVTTSARRRRLLLLGARDVAASSDVDDDDAARKHAGDENMTTDDDDEENARACVSLSLALCLEPSVHGARACDASSSTFLCKKCTQKTHKYAENH